MPSTPPKSDREQEIQRRLAEFHTALQVTAPPHSPPTAPPQPHGGCPDPHTLCPQEFERAFRHLEDLQDAFDFCYKVHYLPGRARSCPPWGGGCCWHPPNPPTPLPAGQDQTNEAEYKRQVQSLQAKLQNLDRQRRVRGGWGWTQGLGWGGGLQPLRAPPSSGRVSPCPRRRWWRRCSSSWGAARPCGTSCSRS